MSHTPNRGPFYKSPSAAQVIAAYQAMVDAIEAAGEASAALLPLHGNGAPTDGVTGVNLSSRMYVDDDTGIMYLNQGSLAVPEWHGVINA